MVMLSGTSKRKIWPLAVKFDPSREIKDGIMPSTTPESPVLAFLVFGGDIWLSTKGKKTRRWVRPSSQDLKESNI